jgi:hypothetical protein
MATIRIDALPAATAQAGHEIPAMLGGVTSKVTVGSITGSISVSWASITGKPATFPPTLPIATSDVTGLDAKQTSQDTAINGKEPAIASGDPSLFWAGDKTWKAPAAGGGGGTTILSGSGAPTASTGDVGNYYIDYDTDTMYGPKQIEGLPGGPVFTINQGTPTGDGGLQSTGMTFSVSRECWLTGADHYIAAGQSTANWVFQLWDMAGSATVPLYRRATQGLLVTGAWSREPLLYQLQPGITYMLSVTNTAGGRTYVGLVSGTNGPLTINSLSGYYNGNANLDTRPALAWGSYGPGTTPVIQDTDPNALWPVAINANAYIKSDSDARYVNTTGDAVNGTLTVNAPAGNPGLAVTAASRWGIQVTGTPDAVCGLINLLPTSASSYISYGEAGVAFTKWAAGVDAGASPAWMLRAGGITDPIKWRVATDGTVTQTGPLVLPADPTAALQAATKQYADTKEPAIASGDPALFWAGDKTWKAVSGGGGGNTFRIGAGPPAAALGNAGDAYIDTLTGILYGPRAAGAGGGSITMTQRGNISANGTLNTLTSASFTPAAGSLLVAVLTALNGQAQSVPTSLTDSTGRLWVLAKRQSNLDGGGGAAWSSSIDVFTATATGAAMTVTANWHQVGTDSGAGHSIVMLEFSAGAVVQVLGDGGPAGRTGAYANTLPFAPATTSHVVSIATANIQGVDADLTALTGFTDVYEIFQSFYGVNVSTRTGSTSTSVGMNNFDMTGSNYSWCFVSLEVGSTPWPAAVDLRTASEP